MTKRSTNKKVNCGINMTLYTGGYVNPAEMKPEDIKIEDISHALSNLCRFAGHCKRFYSVAEHSFWCSWFVFQETKSQRLSLCALLHDATEAYVGDLVRCVKQLLPSYCALEEEIWKKVVDRFGLSDMSNDKNDWGLPPEVREADYRMLVTERLAVISEESAVWDMQRKYKPYDLNLGKSLCEPEVAKCMFMSRYNQLFLMSGAGEP